MKIVLKIGLGIVLLVVIVVALVFYMTSGMAETADQFFAAIKSKDNAAAYQFLSEDFRASTPQTDFDGFIEKSALGQFKEVSWSSRSISGGQGELEGSVTTESGSVVPIKLAFVKENGKWLIYSIQKPQAGLVSKPQDDLPSEAQQIGLVKESIGYFASAVDAKDFADFHKHTARLWQRQTTPEELKEAFRVFCDRDVNLLPLEVLTPEIDGTPSVDENGVLTIKGHYPSEPSRVLFELQYVYEGLGWKLISIDVHVEPSNTAAEAEDGTTS